MCVIDVLLDRALWIRTPFATQSSSRFSTKVLLNFEQLLESVFTLQASKQRLLLPSPAWKEQSLDLHSGLLGVGPGPLTTWPPGFSSPGTGGHGW